MVRPAASGVALTVLTLTPLRLVIVSISHEDVFESNDYYGQGKNSHCQELFLPVRSRV